MCTSNWLTYCGGACVNAATDPANCNTCGNACTAAGAICETGGSPSPTCANVDWARWTIPNSSVEVTNGAPAASLENYTKSTDGNTVTDNLTHLMWQQAPPNAGGTDGNGNFYWADAKAYCPTITLGGYHDWRLPSLIELQSTVDYSIVSGPAISAIFESTSDVFWSATPAPGSNSAWGVYLIDGSDGPYNVGIARRVRCVR